MRIFITALFLIFWLQSWTKADDIRDLEIEGMSIGDNLLNYMNFEKITNNISDSETLKGTKFKRSCFDNYSNIYDRVCTTFLNSKKKTIQSIQGQLKFDTLNYKYCKKRMNNIDKELSNLFKNLEKKNWDLLEITQLQETYPGSTYHPITFTFDDRSRIQLACYNYPTVDLTIFKIVVYNAEIRKLISSEAVKK